ncbi:MAG: hypothetical protein KKE64_08110 [Candidatus Omnitrophica bacterium]|nr:hypothetical protein [Candidatus Omnitrophota bacterium]
MAEFNFYKTCVGSMPHDTVDVVSYIISNFKEIPFWPQLPKRSFLENMYVQYSEKLPNIVIDEKAKKIHVDTDKDIYPAMEEALGKYLEEDVDYFSIGEKYAAGFYEFLSFKDNLKGSEDLKFLKGQVVGPVSLGLALRDKHDKCILYYKEYEELLPKFLAMKARWQVRKLKEIFPKVIIFIDEPYLTSIGSSFINIDRDKVRSYINEMADIIKKEGALCGLHCCGNTEWGFLMDTNIDILSFDAFNFDRELLLYTDDLRKFFNAGKVIAWGIVPTSRDDIEKTGIHALKGRLQDIIVKLRKKGIPQEKLFSHSILTPSCGCGTLTRSECEIVLEKLDMLCDKLWLKNPTF